MKTLYFLRHAKAEPGGSAVADPDRILSRRGQEACALMGAYMKSKAYVPACALTSPSARTKETLERVAAAAGWNIPNRFDDRLYLATAEEILCTIQTIENNAHSLIVVGHNPGMHHIALLLSEPVQNRLRTALELKYPTCTLTVMRFECKEWQEIAPGKGKLLDFVTPEAL